MAGQRNDGAGPASLCKRLARADRRDIRFRCGVHPPIEDPAAGTSKDRLDETAIAPQSVHPQPRSSRGVVAPSGFLAAALDRHPLLPGSGAARRSRAVRFRFPRRPAGAGRRCSSGTAYLARADHCTGGDGVGDKPGRVDRNGLDHLHRTVQSRAAVRLDRPHQQGPCGLEHRDLLARDRGGKLRRRRAGNPRRPLRPGRGVHGGGEGPVGQLGHGCGHRRPGRRSLRAP